MPYWGIPHARRRKEHKDCNNQTAIAQCFPRAWPQKKLDGSGQGDRPYQADNEQEEEGNHEEKGGTALAGPLLLIRRMDWRKAE